MFTTAPTRDWIDGTRYGLGITSVDLPCGTTVWGMGGAIPGSWSYTYGSRDGRHVLAVNTNGDWVDGGRPDLIGLFTEVLVIRFC